MSRYLLILIILGVALAACSPAASEVAAPQPTVAEVAEEVHEAEVAQEEDHEAEHDEEEEHREHGAHEHGAATLTVAWSGSEMEVELDSPGFNLFGFEYEPSAAEDIQVVEEAVAALEAGDLLVFNAEAGCQLTDATVTTEWEAEEEHAEEEHAEEGEVHSDVQGHFALVCSSPDDIRSLDLTALFARFPNLESLEAQWVSDTSQSAAELSAESPLLNLEQ